MAVLLVLGNVTAQQIAPVLEAMNERGTKAATVHVSTKLPNESDFFNALYNTAESYCYSPEAYEELTNERTETLKRKLISEAFGDQSLSDVQAIIREPFGDDESNAGKMDWLTDQIETDYAEYTVMRGDDGNPWLQGEGLGDLEISLVK